MKEDTENYYLITPNEIVQKKYTEKDIKKFPEYKAYKETHGDDFDNEVEKKYGYSKRQRKKKKSKKKWYNEEEEDEIPVFDHTEREIPFIETVESAISQHELDYMTKRNVDKCIDKTGPIYMFGRDSYYCQ